MRDRNNGDSWFYNKINGISQWERPSDMVDKISSAGNIKRLPFNSIKYGLHIYFYFFKESFFIFIYFCFLFYYSFRNRFFCIRFFLSIISFYFYSLSHTNSIALSLTHSDNPITEVGQLPYN